MPFTRLPEENSEIIADINMTPFVDVVLVLLIILMITMPMLHHAVPVTLPQVSAQTHQAHSTTIRLSLDRDGKLYWNRQPIDTERLKTQLTDSTEVNRMIDLYVDRDTRYQAIAELMATLQSVGQHKITFITAATTTSP